jgi:integrase/recombinase XerC
MIQAFETYLATERRYSPHTVSNYLNDLIQFEAFLAQHYSITTDVAQASMLRTWVSDMVEHNYASTSVHRKISTLRAYFTFLQKRQIRADNPARSLHRPKKKQQLPTFIEESAMERFQFDTKSVDFEERTARLVVRLLYETGMRQAELLGVSDASIDRRLGQIKVVGKREKTRFIPLSLEILAEIDDYLDERKKLFGETNSGTILVTGTNKKITKSFVYKIVRLYLSEVTTAKKRSPHVLRHTFATHMLNNGADLNVIKELLGHSSLAATQVYTHNNIEKLKQVHEQLHPRNRS